MSETGGDWRDGAAYDFVDTLAPEQLPFEFLRRNPDYVSEYPGLSTEPDDEGPPPALARWGLRFRPRSSIRVAIEQACMASSYRREPACPWTCPVVHLFGAVDRAEVCRQISLGR